MWGTSARRKGCARLLALALLLAAGAAVADPMSQCPAVDDSQPERWQGQHLWDALQAAGYQIGVVQITVDGVFELDDPQEDTWYGRTADTLHINTRPKAIRDELLFKSGDVVDARRVYESERRLRALPFLRYADIEPVVCGHHFVNVQVHVKDAWSLKLNLSFAHVGGQSNLGVSFEDVDFLGSGKTVQVGHESNVQRTSNQISYQDPALFGGRWQLGATYAHLSDGYIRSLDVGQPFFEDETPWSLYFHFLDQQQDLNFYNQSQLSWRAPDTQQSFQVDWLHLLDWQDKTGTRAGFSYVRQQFDYGALETFPPVTLPRPVLQGRRFGGPAADFEFFQDDYASFTGMALIGRTEDYNLGWDIYLQGGYFGTAFGSQAPAWFYDSTMSYGGHVGEDSLLVSSLNLQGRRQDGQDDNQLADLVFTFYNQTFGHHTLVAHGEVDYSLRPDPENLQYLGGLQGMPGYPNYFLIGDRRWQTHLADRYTTDMHLFNVFQVGFAVYTDAGQIRQGPPAGWSPTLVDAGVALRLGDIRSAYGGVIYVTYAWPLVKLPGANDRQFVIGNILTF